MSAENTTIVLSINPERRERLAEMRKALRLSTDKELINYALGLLGWAVEQREKGFVIMVGNHAERKYIEISMPTLDAVQKRTR